MQILGGVLVGVATGFLISLLTEPLKIIFERSSGAWRRKDLSDAWDTLEKMEQTSGLETVDISEKVLSRARKEFSQAAARYSEAKPWLDLLSRCTGVAFAFFLGVTLILFVAWFALSASGINVDPMKTLIVWSGAVSLVLFLLVIVFAFVTRDKQQDIDGTLGRF